MDCSLVAHGCAIDHPWVAHGLPVGSPSQAHEYPMAMPEYPMDFLSCVDRGNDMCISWVADRVSLWIAYALYRLRMGNP